ncbi:hypothetical protein OG226_02300 [Streptomyces sp. NBC_01261]|uniref:hypothetical protein n=1 Tax=Streptomyces sp. NBC_01261 TaxID=2903802 RepID=UPI002E377505|nr:hypothetical protein [Streptomyces sp. NBC_01261]
MASSLAPNHLGRLLERPWTFFNVAPDGGSGGNREAGGAAVEPTEVPGDRYQIESAEVFAPVAHEFTSLVLRFLAARDSAIADVLRADRVARRDRSGGRTVGPRTSRFRARCRPSG